MDKENLFEAALSIEKPWFIKNVEFDPEKKRLDVHIDFERGSTFTCADPAVEGEFKAYDTVNKVWRHLNFFEHECYLNCRTPRIKISENEIRLVSPPWEGKSKGFTLLFEALIIQLCTYMTVLAVSRMVKESDDKIWRMLSKYIEEARKNEDFSKIKNLGMDETSRKKGHDYISLFADLDEKRVVYVTKGKDHTTVDRFAKDLKDHKGEPENIENVSCDMSPSFIKGVNENFENAKITFDKFHILKIINKGVDEVRKQEVTMEPLLKKTKYIFLKNNNNLTNEQGKKLESLSLPKFNLKSVRALHIRENFQAVYQS
ncbi:MAG: ISL3 family transposase [Oligoflexia bacterium]|nr:ISL3 family transposase [Oligoflexia bacterium]